VYELWLTVHILCAVVWVGGGLAIHILGGMYARADDVPAMIGFNRRAVSVGNRLYAPAAVVLLIAGILLVEEVGYEWSATWVTLGVLGWIFSFLVGILFYPREIGKIDAAVDSDGLSPAAAAASIRRVLLVNSVELMILLLVVVDMAVKPG
jgi:uncharacterized membrane protein